ncbi:EAL domain-containing protein [Pseudomonas sp. RtIB026]|uniref:EAL domain-containing protein n=1 Tax=Pseudomonas sp. RtIB026 TaxID=2749999 RepID=UPI0019416B80|nr:EAL domain-containing protein [Pseudomonas sp. RtIB026]
MKTIEMENSPVADLKLLRLALMESHPGRDRSVVGTLSALGIEHLQRVSTLVEMECLLRREAVDIVVCNIQPGNDAGFMLPSLLQTLNRERNGIAIARILWMGEALTDTPALPLHAASQRYEPLVDGAGLTSIGGIPLSALESHARLARRAGIIVDIARSNDAMGVAEALRALMYAQAHLLEAPVPQDELPLEDDLIAAVTGSQGLRIVLQPQFDLCSRKIVGAEALVRWVHAVHGNISPTVFIPMVNRLDLNLMLFSFVKKRVIDTLVELTRRDIHIPIAVNASVRTVCTKGLTRLLAEKMEAAGLPTNLLKIELTEELPVDDPLLLSASLNALRAQGFQTSLDDFGSGSATMNLLATMPFDEVKIDGSFVREIDQKSPSRGVIATVAALASLLNMSLVAEGIEDETSIATLRRLGCEKGQGYALSVPLEVEHFLDLCVMAGTAGAKGE